jgi:hypothetical protein
VTYDEALAGEPRTVQWMLTVDDARRVADFLYRNMPGGYGHLVDELREAIRTATTLETPQPAEPVRRGVVSGRFVSPTRPFEEVAECYDGTGACGLHDCAVCAPDDDESAAEQIAELFTEMRRRTNFTGSNAELERIVSVPSDPCYADYMELHRIRMGILRRRRERIRNSAAGRGSDGA